MAKKDNYLKMKNSFTSHEENYQIWKEKLLNNNTRFDELDIKEKTHEFISELLAEKKDYLKLYEHQKEAILRVIYSYEIIRKIDKDREQSFRNLLLDIVTGGGKTVIIACCIAYLKKCHNIDKFLILTPNTIVRDRLSDDFTQTINGRETKTVFQRFGIISEKEWEETKDEYDLAITSVHGPNDLASKTIILSNIQQLYYSEKSSENAKQKLASIYNHCNKIAVFNDEAHNTKAEEYENVLATIKPKLAFRLDTTATPERADGKIPDSRKVYEFGVREALKLNLVKHVHVFEPVIRDYEFYNEETKETIKIEDLSEDELEEEVKGSKIVTKDPTIVRQLEIVLDRYEEAKRRSAGKFEPLIYIITRGINDANRVKDILTGKTLRHSTSVNPFRYNQAEVLVVTEESDEKDRELVRDIRKHENSLVKIVISVQMLREGWDVSEVSIILLLRKFSSRVYGQQVIGRGLRRVDKQNRDKKEILSVVDFPKLDHEWLWKIMFAEQHKNIKKGEKIEVDTTFQEKLEELKLKERDEEFEKIKADFSDLESKKIEEKEIPNWEQVIDTFEYTNNRLTLKNINYSDIIRKDLNTGFEEEKSYTPKIDPKGIDTKDNLIRLREDLKTQIAIIAENVLNLTGYPIKNKAYLYQILLDHVRKKFFERKTIGEANLEELQIAWRHLSDIEDKFKDETLIKSIIKFKRELK